MNFITLSVHIMWPFTAFWLEKKRRDALADDDHAFGALVIVVDEIAPGDEGHAERSEISWRDRSQLGARVVLAVFSRATLDREGEAWTEVPGVTPRHAGAERHLIDAGQRCDVAPDFTVEAAHLFGRLAERHDGHVHREDIASVGARVHRLQRELRSRQGARSGQQHEGRRDLRHGEEAQAPVHRQP
jgi:hypothetical protein